MTRVKERELTASRWVVRDYSDEEILEIFPEEGESLVNALLRRAQKAEAEVARLREALKPFAAAFKSDYPSGLISLHDLRMAARALEEK